MPGLDGCREHLYIFEDFISLNEDPPEAEETTLSELTFVFRVHGKTSKVQGCGVRLLEEVTYCILDGKETEDEGCRGINIEANNENASGEDEEMEDDVEEEACYVRGYKATYYPSLQEEAQGRNSREGE